MIRVYSNDGLYSDTIALVDGLFGQSIYIIDYDSDRCAVIHYDSKIILEYDIDYMVEFPEHYKDYIEYPYIVEILECIENEEFLPFSQIPFPEILKLKKVKNSPSCSSREILKKVLNLAPFFLHLSYFVTYRYADCHILRTRFNDRR